MAADPNARFTDIPEIRVNLEKAHAEAEAKREASALAEAAKAEKNAVEDTVKPLPEVEDGVSSSQILGWSLVGVGVVGLGASALFGSKVLIPEVAERFDCENVGVGDCYKKFGDKQGKNEQFRADQDAWNTQNSLTWVSLSLGAAALIGGGVVLYMGAQDDGSEATASTGASKLVWAPYVSADGAGGTFNLSF